MMNEYCINGLTIKENLLRLAGEGNKKFTESLHPGIENVLGVRVPALRQLAAQIAKDDWQAYLQSADTFYMEERMLQGMVIGCLKIKDVEEYLSLVSGFVPLINSWSVCDTFDFAGKQRFVDRNKERYKDEPNIIWFIGGDIRGDVKTAEWEALATSIKAIDKNHLMTFHPRGRTTSATWFNNAPWLDFNMFQSGHRRYGQRFGDGDYPIEENTEEDNWRFVERSMAMEPMKPVIDGEPVYEEIPHGLHDENELLWKDYDVRRYAYWSVFAGAFGHTYGHNSIMQFIKPGVGGAYGAKKPWYDALNDPGYNQMKYLKNLMLTFPFFERIPDQSIIAGQNGERYDRTIATRGNDYLMVYNYTGRPMEVDFSKISGAKKNAWWYTTKDGKLEYIGEFDNGVHKFQHDSGYCSGNDHILIVVDSSKNYIGKDWTELPDAQQKWIK